MAMGNKVPLDGLALEIKAHWKEHRPVMYREMEKEGTLDQSVAEASRRTGEALDRLVYEGMDVERAWEAIREEWAFLPAETPM